MRAANLVEGFLLHGLFALATAGSSVQCYSKQAVSASKQHGQLMIPGESKPS